MEDKIRIFCENTGKYAVCSQGETLLEVLSGMPEVSSGKSGMLAAIVDNQLKELSFRIMMPHKILFVDMSHSDGRRTYIRSALFLMQKAFSDVMPGCSLRVDYNLPSGPYAESVDKEGKAVPVSENDIASVRRRMEELVARDIPFLKYKVSRDDAMTIFRESGKYEKSRMVDLSGKFFISVYSLDGYVDTFYGPLVPSTSYLKAFALEKFRDGMTLVLPDQEMNLPAIGEQGKLYSVFKEDSRWCSIIGVRGISTVTECILEGRSLEMIQIAEALHERRYADIADMINSRRSTAKVVLIAGPSSSGKTTTSRRIALQCRVLGMNPKVIEMDNYFVNRENTPKDEDGNFDFEDIGAMDVDFLNSQLADLVAGKTVQLPTFNFVKGEREFLGNTMTLGKDDILIMEGIHALNPALTSGIPDCMKFRIYASALTSLSIDENNSISTSDNRLLRRIVRDNNFRGASAEDTILRWPSVRRGETVNIFPYQENADVAFNSSLIFELPLLKYYAEPLLRRIRPNSPAYTESIRLLKFLSLFPALGPYEISFVPPTSVMREFIGGSGLL